MPLQRTTHARTSPADATPATPAPRNTLADPPLIVERFDRVVRVRLNRPRALNALDSATLQALIDCLAPLDHDPGVGCFILTGSDRAFAAGADIREMAGHDLHSMQQTDYFAGWDAFTRLRTPKIAAVSGFALGGGCELAMMCDSIYAAQNARFGQPEIRIGVIPGMGGSQRLTRAVGKAMAMDMILTGRTIEADTALRAGLVARIFPDDRLQEETLAIARSIAACSKPAAVAARETVDRAFESGLSEGLLFERRSFHALFANADQKEGMRAFIEKREPRFHHA